MNTQKNIVLTVLLIGENDNPFSIGLNHSHSYCFVDTVTFVTSYRSVSTQLSTENTNEYPFRKSMLLYIPICTYHKHGKFSLQYRLSYHNGTQHLNTVRH